MPSPAPLEMLMMRPNLAAFMPGATACEQWNAPVTLTSKIACHSAGVTSSSGWPTCPSTPPALFTRMCTRPALFEASPTKRSNGFAVADVHVAHGAAAARGLAEPPRLGQFVLDHVARPHGGAARGEREARSRGRIRARRR